MKFTYLVMSDVHLGHRVNATSDIVKNILSMLTDLKPSMIKDLDCIFIAGDLFDGKVSMKSEDAVWIMQFWLTLCKYCTDNKIALRLLEGTPSHDNWQGRVLSKALETKKELNFKYIEHLSIECLNGINVLYIPDEWNPTTIETQNQVSQLLIEHHLEKADIAIMHGMFKYQSPVEKTHKLCHDEEYYLSIVKTFINIGHIHTYSKYNRIIAQGSVDRLRHNEEEKKGFSIMKIDGEKLTHFFIENKNAKQFVTVKITSDDLDVCLNKIKEAASKLRNNSCLQIKAKRRHPIFLSIDEIQKLYPLLTITKSNDDDKENILEVVNSKVEYIPLSITSNNICELIYEEVINNHNADERKSKMLMEELMSIKEQLKNT